MDTTFSPRDANLVSQLANGKGIEEALAEAFPGENPVMALRSLVHRLQDLLDNRLGNGLFAV